MSKNLNEEIKRMRHLANFKIGDNSHDVLSEEFMAEQTRIGTKKKNLEINWGEGKTITLRKGKSSSKDLAQGETKPTKPEEEWDKFLKGDQKMVSLMPPKSKRYWKTLTSSTNPLEKGFAVASLEEFIKTDPENKWKRVTLGKDTIEEPTPDDKEKKYPALQMTLPVEGKPSSDFFDDNLWAPTELLQQTVKTEIIDPVLEWMGGKKECEGTPLVYLNDITVKTSASRFRNGGNAKNLTFLELSKNRNDAALHYIEEQLNNIGVAINSDTVITQEIKGHNDDGSSGPNTPVGNKIATDGKQNTITSDEKERGKYGTPHTNKDEYDQYKYCVVTLTLVLNDCTPQPDDIDDDIVVLEVDNYSIEFKSSRPPLEINLPRFKWNWIKKYKNKNKKNKYRKIPCPVFSGKIFSKNKGKVRKGKLRRQKRRMQ